jgi:TPP-dependent pyruvate/acetoin dehydrogenase alpha subunit
VAFLGDGAANQGAVHEGLNLAAVWKLPVIFVCENNQYAVSMPSSKAFAIQHIADRAAGYGMPGVTLDGNDVIAVYEGAGEAVSRARAGEGPSFIECLTYRHKGHSRFEPAAYRPNEELQEWLAKDPVACFEARLLRENGFSALEVQAVKAEASQAVEEALAFARQSPPAELKNALSLEFKE